VDKFGLWSHDEVEQNKNKHRNWRDQVRLVVVLHCVIIESWEGPTPHVVSLFDNEYTNREAERLYDSDVDVLLVNEIKQLNLFVRVIRELESLISALNIYNLGFESGLGALNTQVKEVFHR